MTGAWDREAPCIEVQGLEVKLGDKEVLRGVDFAVHPGEIVAYLGPNGAGKSTTMKVLTGQLVPTAGSVRVLGLALPEEALRVRARIAYIPEVGPLYDVLTASEYLELVGALRDLEPEAVRRRSLELLDALDLAAVATRPLWTFSRGMRQRVVVASAFLHEPELLLMDEPLYGLDAETVLLVKEVVRRLAAQGIAVVYCSHLLDVVQQLATRVVILHHGKIVAEGPPHLLREGRPGASLEQLFRELTADRDVESKAGRFLARASLQNGEV